MNQLVSASEADPDRGFMARTMALCSLPRSNPGNRKEYKRVNGPYTLYIIAGGGNKLPFGNLPRLLLAWVSTEAVRTQSRKLVLGRSLSEFMRVLGVYSSSGGRGVSGSIYHLDHREQMPPLECHCRPPTDWLHALRRTSLGVLFSSIRVVPRRQAAYARPKAQSL